MVPHPVPLGEGPQPVQVVLRHDGARRPQPAAVPPRGRRGFQAEIGRRPGAAGTALAPVRQVDPAEGRERDDLLGPAVQHEPGRAPPRAQLALHHQPSLPGPQHPQAGQLPGEQRRADRAAPPPQHRPEQQQEQHGTGVHGADQGRGAVAVRRPRAPHQCVRRGVHRSVHRIVSVHQPSPEARPVHRRDRDDGRFPGGRGLSRGRSSRGRADRR
ncbi:hypothetical protein ACFQ1I_32600 [Kitasatospora arboriphila]